MTKQELDAVVDRAIEGACRLIKKGYKPEAAVEIAAAFAVEAVEQRRAGLGQGTILEKAKIAAEYEPIKKAREVISPWLWVVSLVGFGMGLLNTKRIAKMYGEWRMRRARA